MTAAPRACAYAATSGKSDALHTARTAGHTAAASTATTVVPTPGAAPPARSSIARDERTVTRGPSARAAATIASWSAGVGSACCAASARVPSAAPRSSMGKPIGTAPTVAVNAAGVSTTAGGTGSPAAWSRASPWALAPVAAPARARSSTSGGSATAPRYHAL